MHSGRTQSGSNRYGLGAAFKGVLLTDRILIISYLFPPMGGIGVQRALSLAKYLPGCGYEVHVLKATGAGGPVYDPALVRQIPSGVRVHEAFTPEIPFALRQKLWKNLARGSAKPEAENAPPLRSVKRLLAEGVKRVLCPEPEIVWTPFAVRKARQIIRRHKIGSVLVTVPPFSALTVGTALKREFPSLRLISDFRDEWLDFYLKDFAFQNGTFTRRRAESIERDAVQHSTLVVAVNRSSRDTIRRRYPNEDDAKFIEIPNGYDPAIFAGFTPRPHDSKRMVITHVGTVYNTASPRFFLDALAGLPPHIREQVEVRFIGRISENERERLEGCTESVRIVGFIPQNEALKYMEETDFLLLTMTNEISVPGKMFEYMAARKPILAVTPRNSEVDQLMAETGAGLCAPPDDSAAIQKMVVLAYEAWHRNGGFVIGDEDRVRRYERPRLVQEYSNVIRSAAVPQLCSR